MDIELQTIMTEVATNRALTILFAFAKMAVIYLCIALLVWLWKKD